MTKLKPIQNVNELLDNDSWAISFFNMRWNELELFGSFTREYLLTFAHKEAFRFGKNPVKVVELLMPYTTTPNGETIRELQESQWGLDGH